MSTVEHYEKLLARHWFPVLGDVPLTAITRDSLKGELARLASILRTTSIRGNVLVALQACLSAAVEDGLIPASPAARLGRHVRSDVLPQERLDPFTREELAQLLAATEVEMPEWYPLLLTLARTGVRIGEAIALRSEDVDFRARCGGYAREPTKGASAPPRTARDGG